MQKNTYPQNTANNHKYIKKKGNLKVHYKYAFAIIFQKNPYSSTSFSGYFIISFLTCSCVHFNAIMALKEDFCVNFKQITQEGGCNCDCSTNHPIFKKFNKTSVLFTKIFEKFLIIQNRIHC